jgi:hypothetical protein
MSGTLAIPAAAIVSVTPSVISAGGNALDLSGVILSNNPRTPIGSVLSFPSQAAVASFYGPSSQKAALATNYFLGFDNSNQKPGALLIAQYNQSSVGAWLLGGSVSGLSLAQLQALSGVLAVTIDGTLRTSSAINLSSATSFSNAAELISIALGVTGPAGASFTGAIAGSVLTVSVVATGALVAGQEVRGAGIATGTLIASFGTGTGGTGTYNLTGTQTVTSEAMTSNQPVVTYDSIAGAFYVISPTTGAASTIGFGSGTISTGLALTQATGATLSQGAIAAVPATFMSALVNVTQNWACFMTSFDPDNGSGNTQKLAFSAWTNGTVDRYVYVGWDTDIAPTLSQNASASFGKIVDNANSNGTIPIYSPSQGAALAAFEMGCIASLDFGETNGRATMKFRSQTGITPDITNQTVAANLEANGYNYYGAWATADQQFNFFSPGQITGPFAWIDSYVDQIWLNNQFQLALMELLINVKSIPYNQQGYGLIRAAMMDPVNQALNFGAIRAGVTLSQAQIAEVNTAAGRKIDDVLNTVGWYIQILDATPQVRVARGTPPITFFYLDGGSVQRLNLASIEVQ